MAACERHKIRKRSDCPDCKSEIVGLDKISTVQELIQPILDIKEEAKELVEQIDSIETPKKTSLEIKSSKFDEKVYIQALVETEIRKAISLLRNEVAEIKNIKWEHMQIPLTVFRVEMFPKLELEGWKYCDLIRDVKLMQMGSGEPFALFQRVKRDGNPPIPKTFKRYLSNE